MKNRTRLVLLVFLVAAFGGIQLGVAGHRDRGKSAPPPVDGPQVYVDAHNAIRARVRAPANYPGAWQPIPPLTWSDELALGAQEWANHLHDDNDCKLAHSDVRLGENLAGGKGLDTLGAVKLWADEGPRFAWTPVYDFEITTGHYSQVVWRTTTQVGCGEAACGARKVFVCRYSPPGNHIGHSPY